MLVVTEPPTNIVFIEPIYLVTHNSPAALEMCSMNIQGADWLVLRWIFFTINLFISTGFSFLLNTLWSRLFFSAASCEEESRPLWLLSGTKVCRTSSPTFTLMQHGFLLLRSPKVSDIITKEWVRRSVTCEEKKERRAARCHQCREIGVKRMKTYKWKSIGEGRKA